MADFNNDNSIIDTVISQHTENSNIHTSATEKTKWNQPYVIMSYTGNGSSSRSITITNAFEPTWGIIFKAGSTPSVIDMSNQTEYNYFGIFTKNSSNAGLSLSGNSLTVQQSAVAILGNELKSYNENGSAYIVIAFR